MRSSARADVRDLHQVFTKEIDPQFVRFEAGWRSRSVAELERLAALFKAWNDDPTGEKVTAAIAASQVTEEVTEPTGENSQKVEELLKEIDRLKAAHTDEVESLKKRAVDAVDKLNSIEQSIDRNKSSEQIIDVLLKKLPRSKFDTPISDLSDVLSADTRSYCRVHGILLAGELWPLTGAPEDVERDIQVLCERWGVSRSTDIISSGYVPYYWLNPEFYSICSMLVVDVLREAVNPRRKRMDGYLVPGQKVGDFLRKWKGVPGKQQDFQHFLDKSYGDVIHAACFVPDEWQP